MYQAASYQKPRNLAEVGELLQTTPRGEENTFIAGGLVVLSLYKQGLTHPRRLIDLSAVAELREVGFTPEGDLFIGAARTHAENAANPLVQKIDFLRDAFNEIGSPQIRNMGTLGGNLCEADPSSNLFAVLSSLGARVALWSPYGGRSLPLQEFLLDLFESALERDEVLTGIHIPKLGRPAVGVYKSFKLRKAFDRPRLVLAAVVEWKEDSKIIENIRLAVSGENVTVFRLQEAEDLLRGQAVSPQSLKDGLGGVVAQTCKNALPELSAFYQHLVLEYSRQILADAKEKRENCDFLEIARDL